MDSNVLLLCYAALGYWAAGKTIYANKIRIGTWQSLFASRFFVGMMLGWILIPIAIIRMLRFKKK